MLTTVAALGIGGAAVGVAGVLGSDGRDPTGLWREWPVVRPGRVGTARRRAARWARGRDLRALVVRGGSGGAPAGRLLLGSVGGRRVAAERSQSVLVFGPTGSRKTTGLAIPAILGWEGPVVAASVKGDLLDRSVDHRALRGNVYCFDPTGVTGRPATGWSPLPSAHTWPGARRAASTLTEVGRAQAGAMSDGDFWYTTASRMLAPLLFAAATSGRGMADVVHWVETGEEAEVLDALARNGVPEAIDAACSAFHKEERQRSSIVTTLETLLEPFAGGFPAEAGELDAGTLLSGSHTLYLCAPAHDQRRLTPLFVGVLRTVLDRAFDHVARSGRPVDPPLLVVLDEAANIAPIPDLDSLAATAAGHGIQLVTVWHDLAQITARFGPRAMTVVNNHRAKVFLSGISDPSTLDYASHLIGDEEPHLSATTSGGHAGLTTTRSPTVRRLAPPDALRRVAPGSGVLVYGELPPARLTLRTSVDDSWLRARAAGAGPAPRRGPAQTMPDAARTGNSLTRPVPARTLGSGRSSLSGAVPVRRRR